MKQYRVRSENNRITTRTDGQTPSIVDELRGVARYLPRAAMTLRERALRAWHVPDQNRIFDF